VDTSDRFRRVRLIAFWLGALELPLTLVWSVAGAGFYGSPLFEVTWDGLPIVVVFFALGGPLGLLPLAILSWRWPRLGSGTVMAGGACAYILAMHPWGLQYAAPHLYVDVGPAFVGLALVTVALGVAMMVTASPTRGLQHAAVLGFMSATITLSALSTLQQCEEFAPFRTFHPIDFLAFGPDGRTLIAAGRSFSVKAPETSLSIIDADTGRVTILGEGTSKHVLSPDRTTMVTTGKRDTLFWDVRTFKVRLWWQRSTGPIALTAGRAAVALPGGLQLVNLLRGGNHPFVKYDGNSSWFAWSPDGSTLAIGRWKRDVLLLRPEGTSPEPDALPVAGGGDSVDGRYSPDGRILAIYEPGPAGQVRLWDVRERRELRPLNEFAPQASEWFSPDGSTLMTVRIEEAAGPPRTRLSLWDTATWQRKASVAGGSLAAWSPDSASFASVESARFGREVRIVLRSIADAAELREIGTADMLVRTVAFSPDGALVAVAGEGKFLQGYARGEVAVFSTQPP
jgi:hypothetical protein